MSSELATVELPNNTNTLQAQTSTNINNNINNNRKWEDSFSAEQTPLERFFV